MKESRLDLSFTYWELDTLTAALDNHLWRTGASQAEERLLDRLNEKLLRLEEWATDD